MPAGFAIALLAAAFLLGSIPFGYLIYRLSTGDDIRRAGSGNIGATNVLRTAGTTLGLLTLALDVFKGWLAVELGLHWARSLPALVAAVLMLVVLGHLYSPWLRFKGGKGVATALGAFLALA
ncbi:MAG: glycerol-3-phosphate acyltransferase, partial [Terriglobales bacterium]